MLNTQNEKGVARPRGTDNAELIVVIKTEALCGTGTQEDPCRMDRYGPKGLTIYLAILCLVYREGYYLEIPPRSLHAQLIKMIGNRWINNKDFLPEVIGFCGELGLFDADLLSQGVITSRAIQRRYKEATKRNKVDISKYWLLDDSGEAGESMPENRVSAAKTGVGQRAASAVLAGMLI